MFTATWTSKRQNYCRGIGDFGGTNVLLVFYILLCYLAFAYEVASTLFQSKTCAGGGAAEDSFVNTIFGLNISARNQTNRTAASIDWESIW
jgi:hypothetical protein